MADIEIVMEKLQSFETAGDLAEYFMDYGIKATPRRADACALSRFVEIETGYPASTISYKMWVQKEDLLRNSPSYEHTPAMVEFVQNYDNNVYPELIVDGYKFPDDLECDCQACI